MLTDHWVIRLTLAILFHCFRKLWHVKEWISNTAQRRETRIYDIAFRYNMDPVCLQSSLSRFCLKFKGYAPSSAILEENVYLFCIETNEVSFIVVEPGREIWRSEYGSFYKIAQNEHARQVITMPLEDFLDIGCNLQDPGSKLNFIHFIPRSGSTVLIQMFEETGQCISVAEPDDFILDPHRLKPGITLREKVKLFEAIGKYVSRVINTNGKYKWYICKIPGLGSMKHFDAIKKALPQSKHVYLYRDFEPVCKSYISLLDTLPVTQMFTFLLQIFPFLHGFCLKEYNRRLDKTGTLDEATLKKLEACWLKSRTHCFNLVKMFHAYCLSRDFYFNKHQLKAIKYEDIVENRLENTKIIFEYFGLPSSLVENSLSAMDRDSQRNSPLSKRRIRNKPDKLDGGLKAIADEFSSIFHLPKMDDDQRYKNTITVPISTPIATK